MKSVISQWCEDEGETKLRYGYDLNEESIVFDVGGYKGDFAAKIYEKYKCNVFVFEPVKKFAANIGKRFEGNDDIEVFAYGLGEYSRDGIISLLADRSSLYNRGGKKEEVVKIVDVKDCMGLVDNIDLMKVNVEGAEYGLLARLIQTKLIKKINNIQVQFHKINIEGIVETIQEYLSTTHFLTYQYPFVWENWKRKERHDKVFSIQ